MTTITLDNKLFDYSKIDEPLIAVPLSFLNEYRKNNMVLKKLTKDNILKSGNQAIKDNKDGKL